VWISAGNCGRVLDVDKDTRKMLAEAERQGWRVVEAKGGHVKLYAPDGATIVTMGSTESDHRARANTLARMRRAGFKWPPK
jgi:predicted RNA binding protein YcfA (HicA-like mRNA interferase family)